MSKKQDQIAALQAGIASISIGNANDQKIRLIAVIFWHLARFLVLLSVDELKKLVPLRIALALQHKLPFDTVLKPANMGKVRTDGIVAEMFLDLYGLGVIAATKAYSDVPEELRMAECDFAIITYAGNDEQLANWYLQGANNRELARFTSLLARGEIPVTSATQHCIVVAAQNHLVVENGKPVRIQENEYVNGKLNLPDTHLLQLIRIKDIE